MSKQRVDLLVFYAVGCERGLLAELSVVVRADNVLVTAIPHEYQW